MKATFVTSVSALVMYLALTAGSGNMGLWSLSEIFMGIIVAVLVGIASGSIMRITSESAHSRTPNWPLFVAYLIGPFFLSMAKANIDVAYRVVTGRIRPGIVRISPGLRNDAAVTALANSITLTPGTLTVDVDPSTKDLFVHQINIPEGTESCPICDCESVCGNFPKWIGRVFE